jgi:hypothetical protein
MTLKFIDGVPNTSWPTIKDMDIDHRCFDIIMAKKFLDCPDIVPPSSRNGVAKER